MSTTEVSRTLTPHEQFQENLKDRLRKDIGDLMPDEALADIIGKTIEELLIKDVQDKYGYKSENWFVSEIKKSIQPRTVKWVDEWFQKNDEKLSQMAAEFMNEHAAKIIIVSMARSIASDDRWNLDVMVQATIENMKMNGRF